MTIGDHATEFDWFSIVDFESKEDWQGAKVAYRLRTNWDSAPNAMNDLLDQLASIPDIADLKALVIGAWQGDDSMECSDVLIKKLAELNSSFTGLRAIFIGDITYEENEMSWIQQSDLSPLLQAYPRLETLRVRGGSGLEFTDLKHAMLRTLIIETGGLSRSVLRQISLGELPQLEHLEIWLGDANYGWDGTAEDLQPILSGSLFPSLKYLGLKNCSDIDDLTPVIANSPLLNRLEILDLSLGTLSDVGANALLSIPSSVGIQRLDLSHHYVTEEMQAKLKSQWTFEVVLENCQEADGEWRSNYVSE
jgi:hypothetical protein